MMSSKTPKALGTLPPELVLLIASFLSPVDASCLALSSNYFMTLSSRFNHLFGQSFSGIRRGGPCEALRISLLSRLARDLPQYHLCYACLRLHLWRYIDLPSPWFMPPKCFVLNRYKSAYGVLPMHFSQYPNYSFYHIYFVHLQLVMRRFYLGPSFGISAESLTYTEVTLSPLDAQVRLSKHISEEEVLASRRSLMSVEARVCPSPPGLCLRIQSLAVVQRKRVLQLYQDTNFIRVCVHIGSVKSGFSHIINSLVHTYRRQDHDGSLLSREGRCDRCNTFWRLELREIEENDVCLFLAQWKDLKPGLDSEDPRWRTHLDVEWELTLEADEIVDSPRARVEMHSLASTSFSEALSNNEMFFRNVSLLRGRRFQTVMRKWGAWWFLHGRNESQRSRCIVT